MALSCNTQRNMPHDKSIADGHNDYRWAAEVSSLTLLLIYLTNLQKELYIPTEDVIDIYSMIYAVYFSKNSFNIDVHERAKCMQALLQGNKNFVPDNEALKICWIATKTS